MVLGPKEDRLLITGLHTVADISCSTCGNVIGWKYVSAPCSVCLPPRATSLPDWARLALHFCSSC